MTLVQSPAPVLSSAVVHAPDSLGPAAPQGLGCLLAQVRGAPAPAPLPLLQLVVRAEVCGDTVSTTARQVFVNGGQEALELTYIFPVPVDGAMTALALVVGDRRVEAALTPRVEAESAFDAARADGKLAGIVTASRGDVHTLRLTRVPPGARVEVELQFEERLHAADGALWWRFPTVVAPRYVPGAPVGHSGPGVHPDTDWVPDASQISPPLRLGNGAALHIELTLRGAWSRIATSQHAMELQTVDGGVRLVPAGPALCDRDFVLRLVAGAPPAQRLSARTDGHFTEVVLHPAVLGAEGFACPRDAVYLIDISGSMAGVKMDAARLALRTAVTALGPNDTLQMIAFDDRIEHWRRSPEPVRASTLASALAWIDALDARGGTELLPALHAALACEPQPGRQRTVLVITDGQSADEARLVPATANRRGKTIVSTLGIDTAVNVALLRDLAQVGGGVCGLCTPSDDIEAAVARLELAVGSPQQIGLTVHPVPADLSPIDPPRTLFSGRPLVWMLEGAPAEVELRAEGGLRVCAPVQGGAPPLAARWARDRLSALLLRRRLRPFEAEAIDPELTRVSMRGSVLGPTTAWVVVDHTTVTMGQQRAVVQPVSMPSGWAEGAGGPPASAGGGAPRAARRAPLRSVSLPHRSGSIGLMGFGGGDDWRQKDHGVDGLGPMASASPGETDGAADEAMRGESGFAQAFADGLPAFASGVVNSVLRAYSAAPRPPAASPVAPPSAPPPAPTPAASTPAGGGAENGRHEQMLVQAQSPDGSFGGSIPATVAAVMQLIARGHTRLLGLRQRTVRKAVDWLVGTAPSDKRVVELIALLDTFEGAGHIPADAWGALRFALGADAAQVPSNP